MTKDEMIKLLFSDTAAWNKWRAENLDATPNLSYADLRSADLRSANLRSALGVNPHLCTPLLMLKWQPGAIRLFKLTDQLAYSPIAPRSGWPSLKYEVGKCYEPDRSANTDVDQDCGAGINVATLDWCIKEWKPGYRIFVAEFTASDIAAIPTSSDGKIRLHHCKIVEELDLTQIGLVKVEEPEAGK
jgi:hypothetical protein